jgi:hypothetical protein
MTIIDRIYNFFANLDAEQFRNYVAVVLLLVMLLTGFMIYRYYSQVNYYKRRVAAINRNRVDVKELLTRYEMVKRQQADVDALLEKDRDFKIAGYFDEVMNKLGLAQNKAREPETSSELLENGYTEINLYASFSNLNMQKIVQLLDTLETNERIYIKEVEIYKANGNNVNVNILLATLQARTETPPATE